MRIVAIDDVPPEERPHLPQGTIRARSLLTGEPGTPGNFSLQLVSLPDPSYSPRHRHNFDQVRYQMEGDFDFASDGRMRPGSLAYFPEGTWSGPQSSSRPTVTLVLQFGGASGSGYLSAEEYEAARAELAAAGAFEGGVYMRRKPDGGRVNQDAYEAVWEKVRGRALEYPRPRYARPVFMDTEQFQWTPFAAGVRRKLLGVFSERASTIAMWRIDAGGRLTLEDNALYFVLAGFGRVDGNAYARHGAMAVSAGETPVLEAAFETDLLQLGLPRFQSSSAG